MNSINTAAMLLVAYGAVFLETHHRGLRHLVGAQIDLLPALMVCSGLTMEIGSVAVVAVAGGLGFDSLSANPLGISVLPLFIVSATIHRWRELVLRDQRQAQLLLGFAASAAVPLLTAGLLLLYGAEPLLDWWSLWRWLVMAVGGAIATPLFFAMFAMLRRVFSYQPQPTTTFRPDREIKHGLRPHSDNPPPC